MSYAAATVFAFGCYLLLLGVALILFPNTLLAMFGFAPALEVWIRVVGMVVLFEGTYFLLASLAELRPFFRWSVPVRASVIVFFALFVLLGLAPPALLLFGLADLFGAAWTLLALRQPGSATDSASA